MQHNKIKIKNCQEKSFETKKRASKSFIFTNAILFMKQQLVSLLLKTAEVS